MGLNHVISATASVSAFLLLTAPPVHADPSQWPTPGTQPADAILFELERQGYAVGINWVNNGQGAALTRCKVTGYHAPGRAGGIDPAATTVYMDVVCPDED